MALRFQYNKTSLQRLERQLKIRYKALPVLKNKEAALRSEVSRAKEEARTLQKKSEQYRNSYAEAVELWTEFEPSLVAVQEVKTGIKKIAGTPIPVLAEVLFEEKPYSLFNAPPWYADGVEILKHMGRLAIEEEFLLEKIRLLEHARRKTTQKVNLYEKNQIPAYQAAILKIRRFLEDEENLAKSAQKILKNRLLQQEQSEVSQLK